MPKNTDEEIVYTLKDTVKLTALSIDLIRLYEKEFNLQIQRTEGGHRRYTKNNIDLLIEIKKRIQEQNWSYKMVNQWLQGEVITEAVDIQSNLEKKIDSLENKVQELLDRSEKDEQFQLALIQRLDEQGTLIKQLTDKLDSQDRYIENNLDKRDEKLTSALREISDTKKLIAAAQENLEQKPKGFWSKFFGK
ncbi:MerR family transcriptional regulator [Priestia megaterium]|uniref:MerR family transcriptional regulator n=2 Tax=Priestia megaterium TaxID=1404 RepID=UPI000BF4DFF6|nr:MerR family transcriptional regulator [Priestia megaterium]RCX20781.1 DNA-binding transcriptional MerR regulator [Bacillus sp. AG236]MCM3155463.1 MerR family transcriptional regulator [Priestia megaterium]PEU71795.1 MerR family transcriptional regulator [Priestia megaterium]PEZ07327.1 MerR family transcriptional regulator [Priestia megaterium]PFK92498.1 MerR family transcriptional regulator [Priestia megaterium]